MEYRDDALQVIFEDGSRARIPVEDLSTERLRSADWTAVSPGPFWITVPTATGPIEISWVTLRLMTDPEFEAYWERRAHERARRIGSRVREMREARQLDVTDLVGPTGLSISSIKQIEAGEGPVGLQTLERLCIVLGGTLDDLSELPEAPS
ncbi:MAG TPA: helix-turn-helix transcriptional regulator [Thermomicrobiales bacterium]